MLLFFSIFLFCLSQAITYEAEYGTYTGTLMYRSAASNQQTIHLDQGEYVEWEYSTCSISNSLSVSQAIVTYTNDGGSDTLYLYLDGTIYGSIITHSKSESGNQWNVPAEANLIGTFDLLSSVSTHSIKIEAQTTDTYGVEIDKIEIILSSVPASVGECYSNLNGISMLDTQQIELNDFFIMKDNSVITECAEEDNILIFVYANPNYHNSVKVDVINIYATYPIYFQDNPPNYRDADFSSCNFPSSDGNTSDVVEVITTLFDNNYLVIDAVSLSNWWLNSVMKVNVDIGISVTHVTDASYWRITQKLDHDVNDYQQTFVMYQDGNIRLLPHPPSCYGDWIPFGSSIIIGNTISDIQANRPYSAIDSVNIFPTNDYKYLTADIIFKNSDSMTISINTATNYTQITVTEINFSNQTGTH